MQQLLFVVLKVRSGPITEALPPAGKSGEFLAMFSSEKPGSFHDPNTDPAISHR
ncbi:MAG: hypothetical protein ACOY90_20695 [Candidatus Zhuqueibacterota bacterium]